MTEKTYDIHIEIEKHSNKKYEYDREKNELFLDRILPINNEDKFVLYSGSSVDVIKCSKLYFVPTACLGSVYCHLMFFVGQYFS